MSDSLYTGSIMVDFVNPLNKGNMILFRGQRHLGKRYLVDSTVLNFLYNNKANNKDNNKVIYVTFSKKSAESLKKSLEKEDLMNNCVIFTLSENPSDSEYYLLPKY